MRKYIIDFILLLFLVLLAGVTSIIWGQDYNWDLRNYHLYNAWAFINNRIMQDVTPCSGIHTYISPILDVIEYEISQNVSIKAFAFILGGFSGVGAFFLL